MNDMQLPWIIPQMFYNVYTIDTIPSVYAV